MDNTKQVEETKKLLNYKKEEEHKLQKWYVNFKWS